MSRDLHKNVAWWGGGFFADLRAFLKGVFGKEVVCAWCFCGEFAVDGVVNVDTKPHFV
jgi:hypothetical protein